MSTPELPPSAAPTDASDTTDAPGADTDAPRPERHGRLRRWAWEWAKSIQLALIIFALFVPARAVLFELFKIPSGSMEGTLLVGDFLVVNKLLYGAEVPLINERLPALRAPAIGDVVVFQWPQDPTKSFVKRLVGVPGDTLEMRAGRLLRNGILQQERYATHRDAAFDPASDEFRWQRDYLVADADPRRYHPSRNNWGPLLVPPAHYFMLGDNRDNSLDSRYWGFVPDSLVRGSPVMVYYSFSPDSADRLDWLRRVRWARLGEVIR